MRLPIPGGFTVYNALGVLTCGLALGLPLADCADALAKAPGVKGRIEVVPVPADFAVIIDYAHTPDALENILTTVRDFTAGRVICLFGCGGDRDRTKRPQMGAIAGSLADVAVVTSDNPRTEEPEAIIRDILPGLEGTAAEVVVEPDRRAAIRRPCPWRSPATRWCWRARGTRPTRRWARGCSTWTSGRKWPPISPPEPEICCFFGVETRRGL